MGTRDDILAAAARIMRTEGYARATTKRIAAAAGCSEAALYEHFRDETEIFLAVLGEQLPGLAAMVHRLEERAGDRSVRANLEELAATALAFYVESFPITMSLFSSRSLLAAHRDRLHELGSGGPRSPIDGVARYLDAERRLGRIDERADPAAMASLLLGACFQQAFLATFAGETPSPAVRQEMAAQLVTALLAGV